MRTKRANNVQLDVGALVTLALETDVKLPVREQLLAVLADERNRAKLLAHFSQHYPWLSDVKAVQEDGHFHLTLVF